MAGASRGIDWVIEDRTSGGALGITGLSRRTELAADLAAMKEAGVSRVACLAEYDELKAYGVPHLLAAYESEGFEVRHAPMPDMGVGTLEEMQDLVAWIAEGIAAGARVVVHCVGGLGRSGTVAACYLRSLGMPPKAALARVRERRSPLCVESRPQADMVRDYPG